MRVLLIQWAFSLLETGDSTSKDANVGSYSSLLIGVLGNYMGSGNSQWFLFLILWVGLWLEPSPLLMWGWLCVSVAVVKLLQLVSGPKAMQSHSGHAGPAATVLRFIYLGRGICIHTHTKKTRQRLLHESLILEGVLNRCATLGFRIKSCSLSANFPIWCKRKLKK